jgi:hypothetical protein
MQPAVLAQLRGRSELRGLGLHARMSIASRKALLVAETLRRRLCPRICVRAMATSFGAC